MKTGSNIFILLSFIFFLTTSAFTFPNEKTDLTQYSCNTCVLDGSGTPTGECVEADYCGINGPCYSNGSSPCLIHGELCGDCEVDG